jgi:hypothetical protein
MAIGRGGRRSQTRSCGSCEDQAAIRERARSASLLFAPRVLFHSPTAGRPRSGLCGALCPRDVQETGDRALPFIHVWTPCLVVQVVECQQPLCTHALKRLLLHRACGQAGWPDSERCVPDRAMAPCVGVVNLRARGVSASKPRCQQPDNKTQSALASRHVAHALIHALINIQCPG